MNGALAPAWAALAAWLPRSTPQTASSVRTKANADHAAGDRDQPRRRERVEQAAGDAGGDRDAGDHHQPDDGGRGGPPLVHDPLGQQHEERGAGGADADADQQEGQHREGDAGPWLVAIQAVASGGEQAARAQAWPCRR